MMALRSLFLSLMLAGTSALPPTLSNCTMPQKLRDLAPFPVSVVWLEKPGDTMDTIRQDFCLIRQSGFTALKQLVFQSSLTVDVPTLQAKTQAVMNAALDEGLIPWWYGTGGWECITLQLLAQLGIPSNTPMPAIQTDPRMVAYQTQVLRNRIANMTFTPYALGEPGAGNPTITATQVPLFQSWLESSYSSNVTALQLAWQDWYRNNISAPEFTNFTEAAVLLMNPSPTHDYRRYRDSMRWQADALVQAFAVQMAQGFAHDPQEPQRTGGAMMLLNQAYYGWDMWAHGAVAEPYGSLYVSSHLQWHYSEAQHEVDRPVYFTQRMTVDAGRKAWPGEWESTGGPGQYSGGFATAVDGRMIRKLLLSYIAAGQRGIGLWTWNGRLKGQEAMEYQLVNIQGQPSSRAIAAGQISQALDTYRFELWNSSHEPVVAVLYSWENEAVAGRLFMQTPPFECSWDEGLNCKYFNAREMNAPALGRMGWARALMDHGIPWVHVDESDILGGILTNGELGPQLKTLVIPHALALNTDILPIIRQWQLSGGRVVADMPYLLMTVGGLVVDQSTSVSADVFGLYVTDYQSTETPADGGMLATINLSDDGRARSAVPALASVAAGSQPGVGDNFMQILIKGGQYAALQTTTAQAVSTFDAPFDDVPLVLENRAGSAGGSAAFINFEAGRQAAQIQGTSTASGNGLSHNVARPDYLMAQVATMNGTYAPTWRADFAVSAPLPPMWYVHRPSPLVHMRVTQAGPAAPQGTTRHWFLFCDDVYCADWYKNRQNVGPFGITVTMPWRTALALDALTGQTVPYTSYDLPGGGQGTNITVTLPFREAMWIRTVDA